MSTFSIYNLMVDNNLAFQAGVTSGYVLSINNDGSTTWIDVAGSTGPTGPQGIQGPTGPQGSTGSYQGYVLHRIAGTFSGLDMAGDPLTYNVVFPSAFTNSYAVFVDSDTPRGWSIDNKTSAGFTVESNSSVLFHDTVSWVADDLTVGDIGIVVGSQGPSGPAGGPQGFQGPTGSVGPQGSGPTGSNGPQGFQGPTGSNGSNGPQGPTGSDGSNGPQGFQGPTGSFSNVVDSVQWVFDGGGGVISTSAYGYKYVPYAFYITDWRVDSKEVGSIQFDILVDNVSIVGLGNKPKTITTQNATASISGWTTTTFSSGTLLEASIDSVTLNTWTLLSLNIVRL